MTQSEEILEQELSDYIQLFVMSNGVNTTMQVIVDNGYNLNIPRYVDTFEEEEPIDIYAVMSEIKELEVKRADLDKQIEAYQKELGIVE